MQSATFDEQAQRQQQTVAAFNVYRTPGVQDLITDVQVSAWYQGMLVESPAKVVETHSDSVLFEVSPEQGRALEHAGVAFVESSLHGTCFRAQVTGFRRGGVEVELARFVPFKEYMERRVLSRVTPVHAMLVSLSHGHHQLRGRVVDISVNALAALFDLRALERLTRLRDVEVDVWGEYEGRHPLTDFHASGEVLAVRHLPDAVDLACHAVVKLNTYPALERVLKVYVARREREIMATLVASRGEDENSALPEDVYP